MLCFGGPPGGAPGGPIARSSIPQGSDWLGAETISAATRKIPGASNLVLWLRPTNAPQLLMRNIYNVEKSIFFSLPRVGAPLRRAARKRGAEAKFRAAAPSVLRSFFSASRQRTGAQLNDQTNAQRMLGCRRRIVSKTGKGCGHISNLWCSSGRTARISKHLKNKRNSASLLGRCYHGLLPPPATAAGGKRLG